MSPTIEHRENRALASEIKFVVPEVLGNQISLWARERLRPDPHAVLELGDGYQVTSVYFDTEQFDVFHKRGSFGRSKIQNSPLRPRVNVVFLERKLKTPGPGQQTARNDSMEEWNLLESDEADLSRRWFQQRLAVRRLRPVCQISYTRLARIAMTIMVR